MVKKKETKEKEEKNEKGFLSGQKFIDKEGKETLVSDIIDESECWFAKREGQWVLTHSAIEKLARYAGVSMNYDVEESKNVIPSYDNELEHIVRVTIKCKANASDGKKLKKGHCVHSDEDILTVTGEANRKNTPNRGRDYLRKMAEKRAFDIAVLKHLGLYTTVFSEEESEAFKQEASSTHHEKEPSVMPGSKLFLLIAEDVNMILNAEDKKALTVVAKHIKKKIDNKEYASEHQVEYLRQLYQKEYAKMNKQF